MKKVNLLILLISVLLLTGCSDNDNDIIPVLSGERDLTSLYDNSITGIPVSDIKIKIPRDVVGEIEENVKMQVVFPRQTNWVVDMVRDLEFYYLTENTAYSHEDWYVENSENTAIVAVVAPEDIIKIKIYYDDDLYIEHNFRVKTDNIQNSELIITIDGF